MPRKARQELTKHELRPRTSSFEVIELIDVSRAIVTINSDYHCETNRGFGSGDSNREQRDHHARRRVRKRSKTPKCDEIQIRRSEHYLDANQNEDRVTTAQRREQADRKDARRHYKENLKRWRHG